MFFVSHKCSSSISSSLLSRTEVNEGVGDGNMSVGVIDFVVVPMMVVGVDVVDLVDVTIILVGVGVVVGGPGKGFVGAAGKWRNKKQINKHKKYACRSEGSLPIGK